MLSKFRLSFISVSGIVLTGLWSSALLAQAQPAWSEPIKVLRNERPQVLVADGGNGFYCALTDDTRPDVFKLNYFVLPDAHLAFQKSIPVPGGQEGGHQFSALFCQKGGGFLLFTTRVNGEADAYDAYVTRLDPLGNTKEGPMLVHSVPAEEKSAGTWFAYEFSPDSLSFLVYFNTAFKRKAGEKIRLRAYSLNFEMLWRKDLELPYSEEVVQVGRCMIDNSGDAYLLSGDNVGKNRITNEDAPPRQGRYVLFHYHWQENRLKEFDVSLKGKTIASLMAVMQSSGKVSLSGLYSDDARRSVAGTFLFTINPADDHVETAAMAAFSKDFVAGVLSQKSADKGLMLQDYYLDHLIPDSAGRLLLCAEQFFISERVTQDPVTGRQQVDYQRNHNDIIAIQLMPDGGPAWYAHIPKRQVATGQGRFSSYAVFNRDDGFAFYFNDAADNINYVAATGGDAPKAYCGERNGIASCAQVSGSGAVTRSMFFSSKIHGYTLVPGFSPGALSRLHLLGAEDGKTIKYVLPD